MHLLLFNKLFSYFHDTEKYDVRSYNKPSVSFLTNGRYRVITPVVVRYGMHANMRRLIGRMQAKYKN